MDAAEYDYRYWLNERFREGKRRNPKWSLRNYAGKLGVSAPTLSEILNGKRPVTRKMAERLAKGLRLSSEQTQLFVRSAVLAKVTRELPEDAAINQLADHQFDPLDLETFQVIANWYHFAILSLADSRECPASAAWVAKKLGIPRPLAQQGIDRLTRLKLIAKRGRRLVPTHRPLSILTEGYEPAVRQFLHQNLEKAAMSIDQDPAELREVSAITMAIDPENLPKARDAIKRFRRELCALLERGEKRRAYTLAIQLFPLDTE